MTRHDRFVLGPLARNIAWSLVVAGAAAIAAGLAVDPRRTWPNLLIDGFYTTAIAVALRWRPNAFDTGEARLLLIESGATDIRQTVGDL